MRYSRHSAGNRREDGAARRCGRPPHRPDLLLDLAENLVEDGGSSRRTHDGPFG